MANQAILQSAGILANNGQQYVNANSKIFEAISNAAAMYQHVQDQKNANLTAIRQKQMEIEAQKAATMLDPEKVLMGVATKYNQDPNSVTPQEMAAANAANSVLGAKVAVNQYGQAYKPFEAVNFGSPAAAFTGAPQVAPQVAPQAAASPAAQMFTAGLVGPDGEPAPRVAGGVLNPPRSGAETPSPIGSRDEEILANPMAATPSGQMEGLKSDLQTQRDAQKAAFERAAELRKLQPKAEASFRAMEFDVGNVIGKADKAKSQTTKFNTGALATQDGKGIWSTLTGENDLKGTLSTLQADAAFGALQEMRNNSPTGGALGNVAGNELELLKAMKTNLENSQGAEQLKSNIEEYKKARVNAYKNVAEAYKADYGDYPKGYDPQKFDKADGPKKGEVVDGWQFLGGDPANQKNWKQK